MPRDEDRRQLRSAVARGAGVELLEILASRPWPDHTLQLIGDGLLLAIDADTEGVLAVAEECASELRQRDWEGDLELAESLESRMGTGAAPLLRPLTVDLDELAGVLEGDPVYGGGRVDRRTGEVWPEAAMDAFEEDEEEEDVDDDERWVWVDSQGSRAGYRDMERFIAGLNDPAAAHALERALDGRGPFRRFSQTLDRWPHLIDPWLAYADERKRGRARAWLAAEGYRAQPRVFGAA
ncbi:UPF0158 family protein [Nocardioides dilutus]